MLPTGTVTFLFTDIEGSTRLAQQYPGEMPSLLARHNEILKQAILSHNGFIFHIVGDSYSAAFHNTADAVNAALEAQRALFKEKWSPAPVKVRMGIHTGSAQLQEEWAESRYSNYATLALAQRVMSAGHGGQILISQTVFDLLGSSLPDEIQLWDMGRHQLKDVLRTQQLYQLTVTDLPSDFPSLKTQKTTSHNLPIHLTSFIGRERQREEIKERLAGSRLLTLIGPGGTGKTRLSIQVGGEQSSVFPDGVWMAELAPITDAALIPQSIAAVFGLRESAGRSLAELVIDYLRAKELLLILDNCEHLIESCAKLAEDLLKNSEKLKILASSREALGIPGETIYRVPSLLLPDPVQVTPEAVLDCESVQLFVERASAANPDFLLTNRNVSAVIQICLRLDGIPLALELAAARARVLSVEQIAERLGDRFRLLTGGSRTALPRQQTLRALIDWSYDLLTDLEKAVFRRLSVFVGGWTLEAAESVCAGDGVESYDILDLLDQLVGKSLVQVHGSGTSVRYYLLETIRQYGGQKLLESEETTHVRERHLECFARLSAWAEEKWFGPQNSEVEAQLKREYDNFRSALGWALESKPEKALELITWVAFMGLWLYQGYISEAREWSQAAVNKIENLPPAKGDEAQVRARLLARGWNFIAMSTMNLGDHRTSRMAAEKSVAYAREANDKRLLALGLASIGIGALYSGDPNAALSAANESLLICKGMGFRLELMWALNTLMHIYTVKEEKEKALRFQDEIHRLQRGAGFPLNPAAEERELSEQAFERGDKVEALERAENAIALFEERGDKYDLTFFLSEVAHLLRGAGDLGEALTYYRRSIKLWWELGHRAAVAHQLECFAFIAAAQDSGIRAIKLMSAAEALREISNSVRTPAEQKEFVDTKAQLQSRVEDRIFNKAWIEARSISLDQAIEFALEENA